MSIFGKILKTGFDVLTLPVSVAKDVVTLGGVLTDEDEPYTVSNLRDISQDGDEVRAEIDRL